MQLDMFYPTFMEIQLTITVAPSMELTITVAPSMELTNTTRPHIQLTVTQKPSMLPKLLINPPTQLKTMLTTNNGKVCWQI